MSMYDDQWSSRREPVTVPYLTDEPEDEDTEDTIRTDMGGRVHWTEVAAAALWFLLIVVVLGVMGMR